MKRYEYIVPDLVKEEAARRAGAQIYGRPNWTVPGDMRPISVEVIFAPRDFLLKGEEEGATGPRGPLGPQGDFLLKGEEEGAQTTEQQMRDAAEIAATEKALLDAGYKKKLDGTFENPWYVARVDGDIEEGVVPRQRKVSYTRKKL